MAFCFEQFLLSTNLFAYASLGYGFTSSIRLISILSYNIEVFLLLKYIYTGHAAINNFDMPAIFVG